MAARNDKTTDIGILILRLGLGLIILYYGLQHTLGAFGGRGFQGTLSTWEELRGIPQWLGIFGIISEFAGAIFMLLGFFGRIAGFGLACTMATATYLNMGKPGAWDAFLTGRQAQVADYGYPMALTFMALAVVFLGSGRLSLDKKFFGKGR